MLQQIDKPRDDEARLLARVYSLILSWNEPDAQTEPRAERGEHETKGGKEDELQTSLQKNRPR